MNVNVQSFIKQNLLCPLSMFCLLSFCCLQSCNETSIGQPPPSDVTYSLGPVDELRLLYPDPSWLPDPYKPYYTDINETVTHYTSQSLSNDGIAFDTVLTSINSNQEFIVSISTTDPKASAYGDIHPALMQNARNALKGINACKAIDGCWGKNDTIQDQPWAFFLQLGLPMVNQKGILLLNYPPDVALRKRSYLEGTFTMERWSRVLKASGISNPALYETIVDVRPIAAPGSGTSQNLPDAATFFNDSVTGGFYINPQLQLLLDPPSNTHRSHTLPLVVLGTSAREEWQKIIGSASDSLLNTGVATLDGIAKPIPWIMGNHPDVTSYQCCPGDPYSGCDSYDLYQDEQIDFQIACWVKSMSENPDQDPHEALANCRSTWVTNLTPQTRQTLCVQCKQDNNNWDAKCDTAEEALAYCMKYNNDPCATFNCEY